MTREEQIRQVESLIECGKAHKSVMLGESDIEALTEAIKALPEQRTGKWIEKPSGRYGAWQSWCSVCGNHSGIGGIESNRHKPYCPNCGAKMEEGE